MCIRRFCMNFKTQALMHRTIGMTYERCVSSSALICVSITQTRPPRLKVFETCFQRGSRVPQAFALYLQSDFVHAPPPHPDRIDWTTRAPPSPCSACHFPVNTRNSASRAESKQCAEKEVRGERARTTARENMRMILTVSSRGI